MGMKETGQCPRCRFCTTTHLRIARSLSKWHEENFFATVSDRWPKVYLSFPEWAVDPKSEEKGAGYIPMWRLIAIVRVDDGMIHFPESWGQDPVPLLPDEREM